MKRHFFLITGLVLSLALCMVSCKKEKINIGNQPAGDSELAGNSEPTGDGIIKNAVKDYDGNTYDAVKLGTQVWMASNLRTTHYADGTEIDEGTTTNFHHAYRYATNGDFATYGYLYNWPAVSRGANSSEANPSGMQGICPNGWHLPSDAEWDQLTEYCMSKDEYVCGEYLRDYANSLAANRDWTTSDKECSPGYDLSSNNSTGFGAVPAGIYPGVDVLTGKYAYFWGATGCDGCTYSYTHYISNNDKKMYRLAYDKNTGLSVRCVRD